MGVATRKMPSVKVVRAFWAEAFSEEELLYKGYDGTDEFLERDSCMACLYLGGHQRAHIIPRCNGGSDHPSNIHLLCGSCHEASERLTSPEQYWPWFWRRNYFHVLISHMVENGTFVQQEGNAAFLELVQSAFHVEAKDKEWSHVPSGPPRRLAGRPGGE